MKAALTGLLCECAASGDIAGLRVLIHAGAEVNAATAYDMRTPLHLAAAAGKFLGQIFGKRRWAEGEVVMRHCNVQLPADS